MSRRGLEHAHVAAKNDADARGRVSVSKQILGCKKQTQAVPAILVNARTSMPAGNSKETNGDVIVMV